MTVQGNLNLPSHRMEYFLCIEGIGWPTDEDDISSGFDGDVFTTNDLDGTLASILGCTVHYGLYAPSGVSDSYDPRSGIYSPGSTRFEIQDQDDFLISTITPLTTNGTSGLLYANLTYDSTTVVTADQWAAGQTVWIAGREAILLGTEAGPGGSGEYTYSSCTRGYLGTPRGRFDNRPTQLAEFSWEANSLIHDFNRYWYDRRTVLFAHIPGETVGNVIRIYSGRMRSIGISRQGNVWSFPVSDDIAVSKKTLRIAPAGNMVAIDEYIDTNGRYHTTGGSPSAARGLSTTSGSGYEVQIQTSVAPEIMSSVRRSIVISPGNSSSWYDTTAAIFAYNYRNRVPGGTGGVVPTMLATPLTPQAVQDGFNRYRIDTMLMIDGNYVRALHKRVVNGTPDYAWNNFVAEVSSYEFGTFNLSSFQSGLEVRFLLDNYKEDTANRYTVNNRPTYNPVDVLLCHFTSTNNEFKVLDTAAGSSQFAIVFPANSFVANQWVGYALHCVEGANLGEARVIASNTTDTITVDRAFTNSPAAAKEHHIRNSIYDVLPLGWGLGISNKRIDISSFEDVRDKYLGSARLGKYALGSEDEIEMWDLLVTNIAVPYGILLYNARTTHALTAAYIGHALQDGLDEDYITILAQNILSLGDIDYVPRAPLGKIKLKVRSNSTKTLRFKKLIDPTYPQKYEFESENLPSPFVTDKGVTINVIHGELDSSLDTTGLEDLEVQAMFNSSIDARDFLSTRMAGLLERERRPAPEVDIKLDMGFILTVQVGSQLSITDQTNWNPVNPYTGTRGWLNFHARVIATSLEFGDNPGINCRLQLLSGITGGRTAPAADVDSKGIDGGDEYFVVHFPVVATPSTYADYDIDPTDLDWNLFRVGDLIDLRDKYGAIKSGTAVVGTIESFGSNRATLPEGASDGRVYVTGTIAAISAGDHITFAAWSASNTTNMNLYAAWADANETLGATNDDARDYF